MSRLDDAIARSRAAVLSHEEQASNGLTQVYGAAYSRISAHLDILTQQIEARKRQGLPVKYEDVFRHTRLQALLLQIHEEMERFAGYADNRIADAQRIAILDANLHSRELVTASSGIPSVDVPDAFKHLNTPAVEHMVGRMSDGSPLRSLLMELAPNAVNRARETLAAGLAEGKNPRLVAQDLRTDLNIPIARAQTIARTETLSTYRAVALENYRANSDVVKGWIWNCSKSYRTCAMCLSMDGQEFGLDVPFASHVNCIPAGAMVASPGVIATTSRWFDGEIVEIETALGNRLSVTPNHPILTPEGWVAAGLLREGSYVVSSGNAERVAAAAYPDNYNIPTLIEDIVEAVRSAGGVRSAIMPASPEDFHGDGEGSDVHVVDVNRLLGNAVDPSLCQPFPKKNLCRRHSALALLLRSGPLSLLLNGMLSTPAGVMRRFGILLALLGGSGRGQQAIGFGSGSDRNACYFEPASDCASADAVMVGQGFLWDPGKILLNNLFHRQADFSSIGCRRLLGDKLQPSAYISKQAAGLKSIGDAGATRVKAGRSVFDGLAGDIRKDRILKVTVRAFQGHVYNLQTHAGWFIANNIITHNCRCSPIPITVSWSDLGAPGVEDTSAGQSDRETGAEWFDRQPERVQMDVLGPSKLAEYNAGRLKLSDLVGYRDDKEWGPQRWERSLTQVKAGIGVPPKSTLGDRPGKRQEQLL